jgi:hypothetical protein
METTRHIGIDLHRTCFTVCIRLENGRNYVTEWKLEQLPKFVAKLQPSDEVAVEVAAVPKQIVVILFWNLGTENAPAHLRHAHFAPERSYAISEPSLRKSVASLIDLFGSS